MKIRNLFATLLLSGLALSGQSLITTVAGNGFCGYTGDGGPAAQAQLCNPQTVVMDGPGNVYFFDGVTAVIRKIDTSGVITTIAGTGVRGTSGDGGPALSAQLGFLGQLAYDGADQLCFPDQLAYKIRCLSLSAGTIQGYGSGTAASLGDGGPFASASFHDPKGLAFVPNPLGGQDLYIADWADSIVRKVDASTSIITTIAGGNYGGPLGDGGPASQARLSGLSWLTYFNGSLYIVDSGGYRVRQVSLASGIINTVAGNGTNSFTGDGGPATAAGIGVIALTFDPAGDMYLTDLPNERIRKVDTSGIITTFAGMGVNGNGPDNVVPTQTYFVGLNGAYWNASANQLLISDYGNKIRQVTYQGSTTSLAISPASPSAGVQVTLTATVAPSGATGNVAFYLDGVSIGSAPISAGQAIFTWTAAGTGTALTAVYQGDGSFAPGLSAPVPVSSAKTSTTTLLTSSLNPALTNQSITLTATVTPGAATGTIQFFNAGVSIGSVPVTGGTATFTTSFASASSLTLYTTYSGDSNYAASTSANITQTINVPAAPGLTLTSSANPSSPGASLTLQATLNPATATGTIQFVDGSTTLATVTVASGSASYTTSALTNGTHPIKAVYSGDSANLPATSSVLNQAIQVTAQFVSVSLNLSQASPGVPVDITVYLDKNETGTMILSEGSTVLGTVNLNFASATFRSQTFTLGTHNLTFAYSGDATYAPASYNYTLNVLNLSTVALTSNPAQPAVGQSVTLTATLAPANATGTVEFFDNTSLGKVTLTSNVATLTIPSITAGLHGLIASYSGDSNTAKSNGILNLTVKRAPTVTVTSSANPLAVGQPLTFTATVTPSTATGTMQFLDGTNNWGTYQMTNGIATITFPSSYSTGGGPTPPNFTKGDHSITASYSGDLSNQATVSPAFIQTMTPIPTTVTLTSNNGTQAAVGQTVSLNAALSPGGTGSIQFLDGTTVLATINVPIGTNGASFNTTSLAQGAHPLTAVYSGDTQFAGSTSAVLTETIKLNPAMTAGFTPFVPTVGQTVTFTVRFNSGATGNVTIADGSTVLATLPITAGTVTYSTSSFTQGAHPIVISYSGDATYLSVSQPTGLTVYNPTSVAVTSSVNPSLIGQSVTFTANVTPSTATGIVNFSDQGNYVASAPLVSGVATLALSNLTRGAHSITAIYAGDSSNITSTSAALSQVVNANATTTTLTSSANPSTSGSSVTLTAAVAPSNATGTITFSDLGTSLGSTPVTSGVATLSISTLTRGTHSITASYNGDSSNASSSSAALAQVVNAITTTTTLTSTANPSNAGASITLTAAVTPSTATGTIQFFNGTTSLGSVNVTGGQAQLSTPWLPVGTDSLTAVYSGDATDATSTSAALIETVNAAVTTTTLGVAGSNPSQYGQSMTLVATVSSNAVTTGSVQFLNGTTVLATVTLSNGQALFTTTTIPVGAASLTAKYTGDASNAASTSTATQVTVVKVYTTETLVANPSTSISGQSVTLTATLTPSTATGTIQFVTGSVNLGTVTVTNGQAVLTTTAIPIGTNSVGALYGGDANDAATGGNAINVTVNPKTTTTTALISSANPSVAGAAVTFTATVSPATATGTVQFLDGAAVIGTVTVNSGAAAFSTAALAAGSHSISAAYSGDATNAASSSAAVTQVVKTTTAVAIASSLNPSLSGQAVTITATVTPSTATGTVQFLDGATVLGSSSVTGGAASFSPSTLAAGSHSITAAYSGDTLDLNSTSAVLSQVVKLNSGLSAAATPNPATTGQTVRITATLNAGATGTVTFTDGGTTLATVSIASGSASYSVPSLPVGVHSIGASYSGDASYVPASTSFNETVQAISTLVLSSNVNPAAVSQSLTFTASVTPASATGTVQFFDGGTALGSASVSGGLASISTASLAKGTHSITANYSGDSLDTPTTSVAFSEVVKTAATVVVSSNTNPSTTGQAVIFTATLTPSTATGTVQFLDASTVLTTATISSGRATYSATTLSTSTHSITAVYSGDASDLPATSAVLTQTVNPAPPTAPSGLSATAAGTSQINLAWTASATSGVTYDIYSSTSSGFTPSSANRIASGIAATSHSATGLTASTTYYFKVTAVNAGGESPSTSQASAKTTGIFACHVTYNVTTTWNNGFAASIAIQNTGTAAITSWTLTYSWPASQKVTQSWNANYSQTGGNVTLTNMSYNGSIAAGGSATGIGFNASFNGGTPVNPSTFFVNGTQCN